MVIRAIGRDGVQGRFVPGTHCRTSHDACTVQSVIMRLEVAACTQTPIVTFMKIIHTPIAALSKRLLTNHARKKIKLCNCKRSDQSGS